MKKITPILICLFFSLPEGEGWGGAFAQEEKTGFKPSGKVWGYLFGDYFYKTDGDTITTWGDGEFSKLKKETNAFTVRRAYLGYDYNISEKFSTQFLLEGNDGVTDISGRRSVFIKSAYLEWKNLIPGASIFIGQSSTPTWPTLTEKIWGYRSVEKVITDYRKMGKSNDFGIRISGKIDSAGNLGYHLMLGNGTAEKVELDNYKKVYGSVFVKFLNKKIMMEVYGDYEEFPNSKNKLTLKGFTVIEVKNFAFGVEGVQQYQAKYRGDTTDMVPMGFAFFTRSSLVKDKLGFFARADIFNPDTQFNDGGYQEFFFTFGLDFSPHKNVHLMPNIWLNTYSSKLITDPKRSMDIVPRITYYYIFK